jgi:hypothetical protein
MSTTGAAVAVVVFLVVALPAAHWVMCRLRLAACTRDRLIAEACERAGLPPVDSYEGPDSLRLLEDLEAHMKAYDATIADFYEPVGPPPGPDPMTAARGNQNQTRGDQ